MKFPHAPSSIPLEIPCPQPLPPQETQTLISCHMPFYILNQYKIKIVLDT